MAGLQTETTIEGMPITEVQIKDYLVTGKQFLSLWDQNGRCVDCNITTLNFFGASTKEEFNKRLVETAPPFQPDGSPSMPTWAKYLRDAYEQDGVISFDWLCKKIDDNSYASVRINFYRIQYLEQDVICAFGGRDSDDAGAKAEEGIDSCLADEMVHIMMDIAPVACYLYNHNFSVMDCNHHAIEMFEYDSKGEMNRSTITDNAPEYQPSGELSTEYAIQRITEAFQKGITKGEWTAKTKSGRIFRCETTIARITYKNEPAILIYMRETGEHLEHTRQAAEQRMAERRMRLMIDNMPMGCALFNTEQEMIDSNQAAATLFGFETKQDSIKDGWKRILLERQPDGSDSRVLVNNHTLIALKTGRTRFECIMQTIDGALIPVEVVLLRVNWQGEDGLIAFTRDMTTEYKYREVERMVKQRFQVLLDSSPLACMILDEDFEILEVNQRVQELFGLENKQEYIDRFFELLPEYQPDGRDSVEKIKEILKLAFEVGSAHFEWMHCDFAGELIPCEITFEQVELQDRRLVLGYTRDLRELKGVMSMKEHLEHLAFTDSLTGIYNRRYFMETAEADLRESDDRNQDFSLLMLDIDYFKDVNDKYGHLIGDEVLKVLSKRIKYALRSSSVVARYGGEEFVVMLKETNAVNAVKTAWRINNAVNSSNFFVEGIEIPVTVSIGVAAKTEKGLRLAHILKNADDALYRAKESGRNTVCEL